MKFLHVLTVVALGALASCATYSLQPLAQDGATIRSERTQSWAVVKKDDLTLEVSAHRGWDLQFDVRVINTSGKTLVVDSNQFRLYSGDPKSWEPLALISSDEVYRRAEAQEQDRVMVVYSNDRPTYTQQTTTYVGGSGNSVTIVRTERAPSPAPQVVTVANPGRQQRLDRLKSQLFYSVDLQAGHSFQGLVYGESDRSSYYRLVVPVDGKDYEVVFHQVKDKGPFINLN